MAASVQEIGRLQQRDRNIADQMADIRQLREGRPDQSGLFETPARAGPAEVQLKVLRRRGQRLQVEGMASTHKAVAELMRELAADRTFQPSLHSISAIAGDTPAAGVFLLTLDPTVVAGAPAQNVWSE